MPVRDALGFLEPHAMLPGHAISTDLLASVDSQTTRKNGKIASTEDMQMRGRKNRVLISTCARRLSDLYNR
jgi:hypothetical protein